MIKNLDTRAFEGLIKASDVFDKQGTHQAFETSWDEKSSIALSKQPNHKHHQHLGRYAEWLFEHYLKWHPDWKLHFTNLQIISNQRTIGEMDFIVEHIESKQIYHIELACKFYLYDSTNENGLRAWTGPNKKDRLYEKHHHLLQHQLPLLYHSKTVAWFEKQGMDASQFEQKISFKGFAFVPLHFQNWPETEINKDCFAGHWMYSSEFEPWIQTQDLAYIPNKLEWLIHPQNCDDWQTIESIAPAVKQFLKQSISPMIWVKNHDGFAQRIFVVWW
ncbi:MAG: DUF1853 family protein [Salibacteraceae bacterium]